MTSSRLGTLTVSVSVTEPDLTRRSLEWKHAPYRVREAPSVTTIAVLEDISRESAEVATRRYRGANPHLKLDARWEGPTEL